MSKTASAGSPPTKCLACGGDLFSTELTNISAFTRVDGPAAYDIVSCNNCGLGHTSPSLSPDEIAPHYSDFGPHRAPDPSRQALDRMVDASRNSIRGRLLRTSYAISGAKFAQFLGKTGRMLDIGCGNGDFCIRMKFAGWESHAHDFYEGAATATRGHDIPTYICPASHLPSTAGTGFDLVTSWHVLEHAHKPLELVRAAFDLLRPGGEFVVEVPNFSSLERRWFGRRWFALQPPIHLLHFTPRSLTHLLQEAGFDITATSARGSCFRQSSHMPKALRQACHRTASAWQTMFRCGAALRIKARKP